MIHRATEHEVQQRVDVSVRQLTEVHPSDVIASPQPGHCRRRILTGAHRANQSQLAPVEQLTEQTGRRLVQPLRVVDEDHQRPPPGASDAQRRNDTGIHGQRVEASVENIGRQ